MLHLMTKVQNLMFYPIEIFPANRVKGIEPIKLDSNTFASIGQLNLSQASSKVDNQFTLRV
jgi:hypothetical protein